MLWLGRYSSTWAYPLGPSGCVQDLSLSTADESLRRQRGPRPGADETRDSWIAPLPRQSLASPLSSPCILLTPSSSLYEVHVVHQVA